MKIEIDVDVFEKDKPVSGKPIFINLSGDDLRCMSSIYGKTVMIWVSEDEADKIAFQLGSVLQDLERDREDKQSNYTTGHPLEIE